MRKLFVLSIVLAYLFGTAGSALAQSSTLTATVRVNPLEVEVIAPPDVSAGSWFDIKVEVSNLGTETLTNASALISPPSELVVRGKRKRIGNLSPGASETITFRAMAKSSGTLIIHVEVAGKLAGEDILASDTTNVSADGSLADFFRRLIFGA